MTSISISQALSLVAGNELLQPIKDFLETKDVGFSCDKDQADGFFLSINVNDPVFKSLNLKQRAIITAAQKSESILPITKLH